MRIKKILILFSLLLVFFLGGCASMLPSSKKVVNSPWINYNKAKIAYEKIIPGETTIKDLEKLGISPYVTPNIEILTFSDIINVYLGNRSIKKRDLDKGIITCIDAKNDCAGYRLLPEVIHNERKGNFLLDTFRFKRTTKKSGWKFKGLILIVKDVVVYKERPGGKPLIDELEKKRRPLGPIQEVGDFSIGISRGLL